MQDFIDDVMGFNPADMTVFNEPETGEFNQNVYKTNPKDSKSEDGNYRSRIRVLVNPFDPKQSIVKQATYAMKDADGFFMVKSKLGNGDKDCPLFKGWKKLWFSGDERKKEWAKQMYDKSESQWCLVQILEDVNRPELTGQIKVMKLPKAIFVKLTALMNPASETKKAPVPVMDYIFGRELEMDVTPGPDDPQHPERKQREIKYDLCQFGNDPTPIIKTDGTQLFTDEELELIENFNNARNDVAKAKTEKKRAEAQALINENTPAIRELYVKAIEYLKANALDLVKECTYQPWDEATTARVQNWIEIVDAMEDPATVSSAPAQQVSTNAVQTSTEDAVISAGMVEDPFDLPF